MTISMYKASVPIFVQFLTSMSAWLDKTAAYAEVKKIDPAVLLNTRLFPDMFPLARQVRAATDHAINACGRLARCRPADFSPTRNIDSPSSGTRCQDNRIHQGDQAGADRWQRGQGDHDEICERRAQVLRAVAVANFCLPNFYFHATTAYEILRQSGVELGKRDFMGTPPPALAGSDAPSLGGLDWKQRMSNPLSRITTRVAYGASQLLRIAWYVGTASPYAGYPRQRSDEMVRKRGRAPTPGCPYRTADASTRIWPSFSSRTSLISRPAFTRFPPIMMDRC